MRPKRRFETRATSSSTDRTVTKASGSPTLARAGLYLLLVGQLLPVIDFSIVNVALDSVSRSLHANATELELVVSAYGVGFAVCLAMGGRLGDNHGRRQLFGWGIALFSLASLLCGLANSVALLLAARVLQGVGAALSVPQILATIHVTLEGPKHSRALGLYGAVSGLAFVLGQILGGLLVSLDIAGLGWRSVFLINPPIGIAVLLLLRRLVPETRSTSAASIDWLGTALLSVLFLSLLLPIALGPSVHWAWPCFVVLAAIAPLAWLFWRAERHVERQGRTPLVPPSLLRLSNVRFALGFAMLFFTSYGGFMYSLALTLQVGAGFTPLASGNSFVAMGTAFFLGSLVTARIFSRFDRLSVLLMGGATQMAGLLGVIITLGTAWPTLHVLDLAPATMLVGVGQSLMLGSFFRIGLVDLPAHQAGAGSAMLSTVQQAAFSIGPAAFGAILTQSLRWHPGDHRMAGQYAIGVEILFMLLLAGSVLHRRLAAR